MELGTRSVNEQFHSSFISCPCAAGQVDVSVPTQANHQLRFMGTGRLLCHLPQVLEPPQEMDTRPRDLFRKHSSRYTERLVGLAVLWAVIQLFDFYDQELKRTSGGRELWWICVNVGKFEFTLLTGIIIDK